MQTVSKKYVSCIFGTTFQIIGVIKPFGVTVISTKQDCVLVIPATCNCIKQSKEAMKPTRISISVNASNFPISLSTYTRNKKEAKII